MYKIKKYSKIQAEKLDVKIKPSTSKNKKIDVFNRNNRKIASIGDTRYKDYPTYLKEDKQLAEERKRLYHIRHKKDLSVKGSNGWLVSKILW